MIVVKVLCGIVAIILYAVAAYKAFIVEDNNENCEEEYQAISLDDEEDDYDFLTA